MGLTYVIPFSSRIANALCTYITYIGKMLWPARLAVQYPHPVRSLPLWLLVGSALLLAATFNAGTVLALAGLGLLINERAGIVNLGAEGMMLVAAIAGYLVARWLDASIAGSMATMTGLLFVLALLLAPGRGLVAQWLLRRRQRWQFAGEMLVVHLSQHEGTPYEF